MWSGVGCGDLFRLCASGVGDETLSIAWGTAQEQSKKGVESPLQQTIQSLFRTPVRLEWERRRGLEGRTCADTAHAEPTATRSLSVSRFLRHTEHPRTVQTRSLRHGRHFHPVIGRSAISPIGKHAWNSEAQKIIAPRSPISEPFPCIKPTLYSHTVRRNSSSAG